MHAHSLCRILLNASAFPLVWGRYGRVRLWAISKAFATGPDGQSRIESKDDPRCRGKHQLEKTWSSSVRQFGRLGRRSIMARALCRLPGSLAQPRIERVSQPIAQKDCGDYE